MSLFSSGTRVELVRDNPYYPVRTGTVTAVVRRGYNQDPDVLRVWWNELGYEHDEPATVLNAIDPKHYSTFDMTLHAGYAHGGSDLPPMILLRHLWEIHYRVISAHNNTMIAGGHESPVYTGSEDAIKGLIALVFKGMKVEEVLNLMYESGEVPEVRTAETYLNTWE